MGGHVYIMCNINNTTLYTGVTANLPARVAQHKEKEKLCTEESESKEKITVM